MADTNNLKVLNDKARGIIANGAAIGAALSIASSAIRQFAREAVEYQAAMEREILLAKSSGMTIQELRKQQAFSELEAYFRPLSDGIFDLEIK